MDQKEIRKLASQCTRFLIGHPQNRWTAQRLLAELSEWANPDLVPDMYGQGELIEGFEAEIASLLGKEAAVFMPSGTMCQQIALRIWAERKGIHRVAFHPKCHLEIHEHKAYQILHGLHGVLVGSPDCLLTLDDLERVKEPLAALLLELPQREIGGQLPAWQELKKIIDWASQRGIATHLDGARLWECKPFYQRDYAEIASLFDTVYVSFYKILGGIAGAVLAGPSDLIAESRIWQRRHGGNLVRMYPFVLSAKKGIVERLGRMHDYHQKALEIAAVLKSFPQIDVVPNPPHTNMMHVYIRGNRERLEAAALGIARETQTWLFYPLMPSPIANCWKFEWTVGDATLELTQPEIAELFKTLLNRAGIINT